jgi:hypothetical protein
MSAPVPPVLSQGKGIQLGGGGGGLGAGWLAMVHLGHGDMETVT